MQESVEVMKSKVEVFNKEHPEGSKVTVITDFGKRIETRVAVSARILGGHTVVLWLESLPGCYSLDRVIG